MELSDILKSDGVLASVKASSKKQLLQELADRAGDMLTVPSRRIFDTLLERERLGSTGVGNGIAIPHAKLAEIDQITGLFVRLFKPIDFEAQDDRPVDLIFLLLAPEGAGADHLKALSRVARVLREPGTVAKIRETEEPTAIYSMLTAMPASDAA